MRSPRVMLRASRISAICIMFFFLKKKKFSLTMLSQNLHFYVFLSKLQNSKVTRCARVFLTFRLFTNFPKYSNGRIVFSWWFYVVNYALYMFLRRHEASKLKKVARCGETPMCMEGFPQFSGFPRNFRNFLTPGSYLADDFPWEIMFWIWFFKQTKS